MPSLGQVHSASLSFRHTEPGTATQYIRNGRPEIGWVMRVGDIQTGVITQILEQREDYARFLCDAVEYEWRA